MHYLNMALIDKASLLFVPSVVAQEKAFNILPSGNRAPDSTGENSGYDQTRADFTFDRGTDHGATRIGSDGLIKKYRENKLLQSNAFSTSPWNTNLVTATSGQSGYDGNNDAWKIDLTGAAGNLAVGSLSVGNVGTYSVYAKAGTLNWILLGSQSGNIQAYINLSDGSIGTTGSLIIEAKTEDVGGGWYRCSMTYSGIATVVRVYPAQANGNLTATSGNIYIQNAQLESGMVSTDYLDSGATTGKAGVLIDLPRINYDANGENGSLLLEPSRQQLLQYSEYFEGWTDDWNTSLIANALKSPTGFEDAYKMSAGTSNARQARTLNVAANGNLVFSIYAKKGEYSVLQLTDAVDGNLYANFDLENGVFGNYNNCTPSIEDAGDGWHRCLIFWNTTQPSINKVRISIAESKTQGRLVNFAGNGTDGLYLFGAMLEQNATYATSYIPNHGESGGVTRAADSCSVTGVSDVIGQTEGVIFMDFVWDNSTASSADYPIMVYGSDTSNFVGLNTNTNANQMLVYSGGSAVAAIGGGSFVIGQRYKIAMAYKVNDFVYYINGEQKGTDTAGAVPVGLANVRTESPFGGKKTGQKTRQITFFKERLSNAELATLTTL